MAFWPKEIISELVRLVGEGLTYSKIAKKINVSRNAAIGKARRLGLGPTKNVPNFTMRLIPMMELSANDCRYPVEAGDGFVFCGLPKTQKSYCAYHAQKCYISPKPIKKSAGQNHAPYKRDQTFF